MAFWSQATDPRRFRTTNSRSQAFRETSPDDTDMFFESTPNLGFSRGHNLADRIGTSVFEDFPARRTTMRNFPSRTESPTFSNNLHRHRPLATWTSTDGAATGSPQEARAQFFQRSESIPVHVAHESGSRGSRSSTPDSNASGHSRPSSNSGEHATAEQTVEDHATGPEEPGLEEHPGVSARVGKPGFVARRQPKIHHIPIHVEPRDGGSQPVVLTPPVDGVPPPQGPHQSESPLTPRRGARACNNNNNNNNNNQPLPPQQVVFAMPAPPEDNHGGKSRRSTSSTGAVPATPPAAERRPDEGRPATPKVAETQTPRAASPPPQQPSAAQGKRWKDPTAVVEEVRLDVEHLKKCVMEFDGVRGDKQYLFLDEMLTRDLIRLDNIDTEGNDELRRARRAVIDAINCCIQDMEQKVSLSSSGSGGASANDESSSSCAAATTATQDGDSSSSSVQRETDAESFQEVATTDTTTTDDMSHTKEGNERRTDEVSTESSSGQCGEEASSSTTGPAAVPVEESSGSMDGTANQQGSKETECPVASDAAAIGTD